MANCSFISFFLILLSCSVSLSHGQVPSPNPPSLPIKAVNLGGWLVTEGWIKPSLFDGIPNKDLLDGTALQLKSVKVGKYLSAKNGGGASVVASGTNSSGWETFKLWRINETTFNFRALNKQFVGLDKAGNGLVAIASDPASSETFIIVRNTNDQKRVRIQASNGLFVQMKEEEIVTADYPVNTTWGDDDPSVFTLDFKGAKQGEYQVTNGYGPKASQVMNEHWSTYIVEDDFKFIKDSGLNSVRIPVGWWIAKDPNPPKPFVGGSLKALDNAFSWAEKYGLKVIIDLHAAPGCQNNWEHSGTRDGSQEWGTPETIQQTVDVIDFLAARYAKSPSLVAVELMNEPLAPGTSFENVTTYYKAGYDAVRKHSPTAYVIFSNRLGPSNNTELFPMASGLTNSVIDVHYYNVFGSNFANYTVEQNINYVKNQRATELDKYTSFGPLILIGEWVGELQNKDVTKEQYQAFVDIQLEVFKKATFGWAYWCLKNANNHWSLEWMIKNGYIKLV